MFRIPSPRLTLQALLIFLIASLKAPAHAQPVDPTEASIRILQRALTAQRDGSHLSLLFALRQLRDPDLRPVFMRLIDSDQWQIQVHGALGLGEIDANKRIDPDVIAHLLPQAQDAIVATALDLELLGLPEMQQILKREDVPPMARLVLLAELISLQQAVDAAQLRPLAQDGDERVSAMAATLLAQLGEKSPFEAFRSRCAAMETSRRIDLQLWMLEAVRRYKLTAVTDWVKQLIEGDSVDADLAARGVYTLLAIDEPAGLAAWARLLGPKPTYSARVRYATILLASPAKIPASTYDRLRAAPDEELLAKLVAVGKAMSSSSDPTSALADLIDLCNIRACDTAMDIAKKLPPTQAQRVYLHMINQLSSAKAPGDVVARAVTASSRLFRIDPDMVLTRLRQAEDDSVLQQALLLGLFEANSPAVGDAVKSLRRNGADRADSLALLLMAKYSDKLDPADLNLLGKIAAGGGRVSDVLQVQAAWMYLKHTGQKTAFLK